MHPDRPAAPPIVVTETETSTYAVEARSYELDPYGHVNNAVYVNWLEHGRLVYLRDRGLTYTSIPETYGVHVVVVQLSVAYRAEVKLGDRLDVATRIVRFGTSSFTFAHRIVSAQGTGAAVRTVAEGDVTMVCTAGGRSVPMPHGLRERLAGPRSSGLS